MTEKIKVLLIEDEEYDVRRIKNTILPFVDKIEIVTIVSDGKSALDLLEVKKDSYDLVIMDFQIAGGIMGDNLIRKIKDIDEALQIIVITKMTINITDYDFANKLIRAGAFWYCTKYPGDIEEYIYQPTDFILSIYNAFEKCQLTRDKHRSNQKLIKNIENILNQKRIVGNSAPSIKLKDEIKRFAKSNVNTLIRGASGTGKELVAYNIHYNSQRRFENFIIINCGSIPPDLIESELFGYEKGAFTGADKKKPGLFEIAHNGTIFLDEITELPLIAQVKLLRVIQDGEIEKIGRTEKIKVNVRIIAATNRDIEEEVKQRKFREDLYYRLNVLPIYVPTLKNRLEDIPLLVDYFIGHICFDMGRDKPKVTEDAIAMLKEYEWPGNIRELKNIVQRFLFNDDPIINREVVCGTLGYNIFPDKDKIEFFNPQNIIPLKEMEKMIREKYFIFVRKNSLSDTDAAKKLGLAPPNYYRMAKELGIK